LVPPADFPVLLNGLLSKGGVPVDAAVKVADVPTTVQVVAYGDQAPPMCCRACQTLS
jgi:hypothetical protein